MTRPKLLDLFSGAGGCARGYQQAGFHVTGVDIRPQPRFAGDVFIQADAMTFPLDGFDVVTASPPCQRYSRCRHMPGRGQLDYPMLIEPVLERLRAWGGVWVLENVPDAHLDCSIILCGQMFGLGVYRHRHFASNVCLLAPAHIPHREVIGTYRLATYSGRDARMVTVAGHLFNREAGARAMGIDWMTRDELAEAIPPAYTRFVGSQLMQALGYEMQEVTA